MAPRTLLVTISLIALVLPAQPALAGKQDHDQKQQAQQQKHAQKEQAQQQKRAQKEPQGQQEEHVYGSELMTPQERAEHRAKMQAAKTSEERERIRKEHHELMKKRAEERGMKLPDEPPARGMGRGPGSGTGVGAQGRGMGPGAAMGPKGGGMGPGAGMGPKGGGGAGVPGTPRNDDAGR